MTEYSHYLKRLNVALEVNDRTNRLRDDEIRHALRNHVPAAVLAKEANLTTAEVAAIAATDTPRLLPRTDT